MATRSPLGRLALVGLMVVAALTMVAPLGVAAKSGDIIRTGACSNRSDWKLKLSRENGRIEVEYEVDTPRAGQAWSVRLFHNGARFFAGQRTTNVRSGSFEVRRPSRATAGPLPALAEPRPCPPLGLQQARGPY
ncbi:hypothetical protein BH23CHL7_BH23CHL7_07820 [soil metagenome]